MQQTCDSESTADLVNRVPETSNLPNAFPNAVHERQETATYSTRAVKSRKLPTFGATFRIATPDMHTMYA